MLAPAPANDCTGLRAETIAIAPEMPTVPPIEAAPGMIVAAIRSSLRMRTLPPAWSVATSIQAAVPLVSRRSRRCAVPVAVPALRSSGFSPATASSLDACSLTLSAPASET